MGEEHEIEGLMETAMKSLREMVDVNTIIGDIIESSEGVAVIPVSRVACGFIAGGGNVGRNCRERDRLPFAGGSGAGISVQPVGFLVICNDQVRLIPVSDATPLDKAVEAVPVIAEQLKKLCCRKSESYEDDEVEI